MLAGSVEYLVYRLPFVEPPGDFDVIGRFAVKECEELERNRLAWAMSLSSQVKK